MTSKVFITQETALDFSHANKFGDVEFITATEFSPQPASIMNQHVMKDVNRAAEKFNPDTDYLLVCGDPIIIGIAMNAFLQKAGVIKVLKYKRSQRGYMPHIVDIREERANVSNR